jgi:hypothetical protein
MEEYSYGGFSPENIRKWIIKECIESGDPDNFFMVLRDVIEGIDDYRLDCEDGDYWDKVCQEK